jgi:hypothetical protein
MTLKNVTTTVSGAQEIISVSKAEELRLGDFATLFTDSMFSLFGSDGTVIRCTFTLAHRFAVTSPFSMSAGVIYNGVVTCVCN